MFSKQVKADGLFSRLNTSSNDQYKRITSKYEELVNSCAPFGLFITLTFALNMNTNARCEYASKFLKLFNQEIIGRKYQRNNDFLKGFAFFEDHKSTTSEGEKHVHMLIQPHPKYKELASAELQSKFQRAALLVKNHNGRCVFHEAYINLQKVHGDARVISYCFKQIDDKNLDRIKMIDVSGLDSYCDF